MKNEKGFTLIELLAVVVILGLLMTIAIPNTISMIDKNKQTSYIESAKTFVSLVKSKLKTDRSLDYPSSNTSMTIVSLEYLNTNDLTNDSYGNEFDKKRSYVAVTLESNEYKYYVTLISCKSDSCNEGSYSNWRGIVNTEVGELSGDNRYEKMNSSNAVANSYTLAMIQKSFPGKSNIYKDGSAFE